MISSAFGMEIISCIPTQTNKNHTFAHGTSNVTNFNGKLMKNMWKGRQGGGVALFDLMGFPFNSSREKNSFEFLQVT